MRFYLGTHEPSWLGYSTVPLFLSAVRLRRQKRWPTAVQPWCEDSGGFSMLSLLGHWPGTDDEHGAEVTRHSDEIGMLEWAAPRDWMCEPVILAKTGLTVTEHQERTIRSLERLRTVAPRVHWIPILQGWTIADYLAHERMYERAGFPLACEHTVGVGSVCRRQGTTEGAAIMREVSKLGIAIHAFGIKTDGIALFGDRIQSADSMAWSFAARRRNIQLDGHAHKTCANCYEWAIQWRADMLAGLGDAATRSAPPQTEMPW